LSLTWIGIEGVHWVVLTGTGHRRVAEEATRFKTQQWDELVESYKKRDTLDDEQLV
jgi:hypothetical protein